MNKLEKIFKNKKVCIPFLTAGDPTMDITEKLLYLCEEEGADMIELGVPFSDPAGEGNLRQEANERALAAGCTTDKIFEMLEKAAKKIKVPIVLRSYLNPVCTYGKEKFLERCTSCRIAGLIIADLPFEERDELEDLCRAHRLPLLFVAAPAPENRIRNIARNAEGFVYCLAKDRKKAVTLLDTLRRNSDVPCVAGMSDTEREEDLEQIRGFDGAVLETGLTRITGCYGENCLVYATQYMRKIRRILNSFVNEC